MVMMVILDHVELYIDAMERAKKKDNPVPLRIVLALPSHSSEEGTMTGILLLIWLSDAH